MPYQQVTLATIRSRLEERWESVPFWDDSDALLAINETLRCWNMLTAMWKRKVTFPTMPGQVYYSVPSTLIYNLRMDVAGRPLEPSSKFMLDNTIPRWKSQTTATTGAPAYPRVFAPLGLNLFAIWPADAVGGKSFSVDGVRATPVLVLDADFIDAGEEELSAVVGMALHVAAFKEGGARWKATFPHYKAFLAAASDKNDRLRASTFFRNLMGLDIGRGQRSIRIPGLPLIQGLTQMSPAAAAGASPDNQPQQGGQ